MFKVGMLVSYGGEGVCKIGDIQVQDFFGGDEKKKYYVLEPIDNKSSKLYVPVDNEILCKRMQKLLDYDEIISLINNECTELEWITDNKLRNKYHKDIIKTYDKKKIVALAKRLYEIKNGKYPEIKKLYSSDEDTLKKIAQILYIEFSYTVDITQEQVLPFICGEINCKRK